MDASTWPGTTESAYKTWSVPHRGWANCSSRCFPLLQDVLSATFGSVGDFLSISILVKDLLLALDDSRGSSRDYQEVVRKLYILDA
jgi:hypothetical protein